VKKVSEIFGQVSEKTNLETLTPRSGLPSRGHVIPPLCMDGCVVFTARRYT